MGFGDGGVAGQLHAPVNEGASAVCGSNFRNGGPVVASVHILAQDHEVVAGGNLPAGSGQIKTVTVLIEYGPALHFSLTGEKIDRDRISTRLCQKLVGGAGADSVIQFAHGFSFLYA